MTEVSLFNVLKILENTVFYVIWFLIPYFMWINL